MIQKHPFAARLLLSSLAAAVCLPAQAEDFNFEVPVEIDIATAGARRITARVRCGVYWQRVPGETPMELGFRETTLEIDPTTGQLHTIVSFSFNSEFPVPAAATKTYTCGIEGVGYMYGAGVSGLSLSRDTVEADYRRVTGFSLTRAVMYVEGEIPGS
jgi:hypothetical protein